MPKVIMGILQEKRHETATRVQDILTRNGCFIKTRIGLHKTSEDGCSEQGLIIVEFEDRSEKNAAFMENELSDIGGITVKKMEF